MRILVTGGRDYGWKWVSGNKVPNYDQRRKLERVLEKSHRAFVERQIRYSEHEDNPSSGTKVEFADDAFGYSSNLFYVIQGGAKGADQLAREWGQKKRGVVVDTFPALWNKYPKAAGPIRNQVMLKESNPNGVIAFPGGKGTAHMVKIARKAGVPVLMVE